MSVNNEQKRSSVGLLFIFGDIISNNQRDELFICLKRALNYIDYERFNGIEDLFNDLIHLNEFNPDSQYRQISNTIDGSIVGFLYLPHFHTVLNIIKEYFTQCSHVSIIFCGQQIDSNGSLILSDSIFTSDHINNLFDENSTYIIENLHILLPYVSQQWLRLIKQKYIKTVTFDDLSKEINLKENLFGLKFYEQLISILTNDTVNFDIYTKLVPRESSGTIAFDEPNFYVLYGQHGEASLFGIRGFIVLINGGFSRTPSYWNLIRGLQNIDACILTHFDYDVLPGLQSIFHRKTIPSVRDGSLCKPDIGAVFLNHIQRAKYQSVYPSKVASSNKLLVNLSQSIDQILNDIKQLNIDTYDLIKHTAINKSSIEPINLYKKIAFGSLDLYVLFPTLTDDEKTLSTVQKIPIRGQQPSPSVIPLHHWYSSCSLLVWTPTSKSTKANFVRILYTGACPQTLVFEALARARHLEFLHESHSQRSISRASSARATSDNNSNMKHHSQKTKQAPIAPTTDSIKSPRRPTSSSKVKTPTTTSPTKSNKTQSATTPKKTTDDSSRTTSKSSTPVSQIDHQENKSSLQDSQFETCSKENGIKHPESISFTNVTNETLVQSNQSTPIEDISSKFRNTDPMTTSFVDGAPNTQNPFVDKTDDLDIIEHNLSATVTTQMTTIDEISLQGLPMNDDNHLKKSITKKAHAPTIPMNTNIRRSKQTVPPGPIFYVDVAYIPYRGNENYVDGEFFRRIRARYYILNAVEVHRATLESLIEGKQQWDKQEQIPVTIVPTFDSDQLRQFFVMNKSRLSELNVNILPASTRCNVQYDDEGSPAQRLRFSQE